MNWIKCSNKMPKEKEYSTPSKKVLVWVVPYNNQIAPFFMVSFTIYGMWACDFKANITHWLEIQEP